MFDFIKKEMEQQEKMKRRADILYPSMKIKDGSDNKKKFIGLGKSIFDDEDNDENTVTKDYVSNDKTTTPKTEKPKKDYQKTADILYPTMKDKKDPELELIKQVFNEDNDSQIKNNPDKINTKIDKKEIKPEKEEEIKSKPGEMKVPEKKQGDFTGGAANINDNRDKPKMKSEKQGETKSNSEKIKISENKKNLSFEWQNDKNFNDVMQYLYPSEGKYSNRKEDLGGPTNLGVTQSTFDWYNKKHNLPQKDVKNITKGEAEQIYYDYFWKQTGASDIKDKALALMYFDAAVNHGPYYAKKYYKESNGDYDKFMQLRKDHYKRMADNSKTQKKNYNGWMNRLNNLQKYSDEHYK